ncbi:hypothetical protein H6B11_15835 [Mediterraneibacter glycyrrhizinilyticus]|nr:hypothetical protein [Mediterraneibacter glycyrrhizinilyticus]MBM6855593.1 hypothetical protein [Mediterraneibacter glycyrrhizinilyticus]
MKRTKKRVLVSAACLLGVSLLTGCVQKFDAEGYVKACLDALYMRDYEEYAQQVGISVEEAQSDMEGQVDESLESAFAGDTLTSEEDRQAYRDTMIEIYSLAKYEVTGSEENDGDYIVTVSVQPSSIFEDLENGFTEVITEKVSDGSFEQSKTIAYLNEYLKQRIAENVYGEATEIQVNVTGDENHVYTIPEEDLTSIEGALFPGAV